MGLAANRGHALPRWLAIVTVVLGVLALVGPGVLLFWLFASVWFVVAGFLLERDSERLPGVVAGAGEFVSRAPN